MPDQPHVGTGRTRPVFHPAWRPQGHEPVSTLSETG